MSSWRRRAPVIAALLGAMGATIALAPAEAAPPKTPKPTPAPLAPLALLPSIARVKVTSHGSAISVIEEINLPRGEWAGDALRFHVAFGAPGPRAIDAHLVSVGDGELEAEDGDRGETLTTERAPRRPPNAHPLLGAETMAGIVVQVPADSLTKAFARGSMATLRIRSLTDATEDASGALGVVVRLGASRGTPLTLGRLRATSSERPLVRVEAKLCGPDADPHPLAIEVVPKLAPSSPGSAIAPVLSVRHASDDLCVRLWHAPPKR